jgi:CBS domain-containing protein
MKSGIKVGDLMTRNYIYVSPDTNLKKCAEILVKKRVSSLIVKEKDELMGILTEKDIVWAIVKKSVKDLDKILAKDIAKRKVLTIKPGADILEALNRMKKEKVRRFPVIENGKVIGMITLKDILKIEPGLFELISETEKIKSETEKLKAGEKLKMKKKDGICEDCGEQDILYEFNNTWTCLDCYNKKV